MRAKGKLVAALLCSASVIASQPVAAQDARPNEPIAEAVPGSSQDTSANEPADEIIVTGSRVVADGNNAPTPVTVVSTEQLQTTTPTTIAEGLTKLPVFGASGGRVILNGSPTNGYFLSLRNFGAIRTLVLLDGRRVTPSEANGNLDSNTLPQMLVQRVDVVTGGASAVYGSDAVTGVVNYVLDHNFDGLRAEAQNGISERGDGASFKAGVAAGRSFMDDKLHLEASYEYYNANRIPDIRSRPNGAKNLCLTGNATVANPFDFTENCTYNLSSYGGLILSGPGAGLNFKTDGVLTPFVRGLPTGSTNAEIGGDGVVGVDPSNLAGALRTHQAFARADFELGSNVDVFVQGRFNKANTKRSAYPAGAAVAPIVYSTNNPYLTPAAVAQLGGPNRTFTMARIFNRQPVDTRRNINSWEITAGVDGKLGSAVDWNLYYTHGNTRLRESRINNLNLGNLLAALDAVRDPSGNIVCRVTLTNPSLFPGCTPINAFGPTTPGDRGWGYTEVDTSFVLKNKMDDVGATVAATLFSLPGGPVKVALSGEYRRLSLNNKSNFRPSQTLQNSFGTTPAQSCANFLTGNCNPTRITQLYVAGSSAPVDVSMNITEVAFEANLPLLQDVPLIQLLELNGGVRYAHYSTSGNATTWKVGAVWHVTDDLVLRGARSRDIRAPTLFDLYAPESAAANALNDLHTGITGAVTNSSRGNPDLVPEVADTYTFGVVLRPRFIPRFSLSADYFNIKMDNAITNLGGGPLTNLLCEQSNGTSPLCSLFVRPLPFSDRSPANFPTRILTSPLNLAKTSTHGVDVEANYLVPLAELGQLSLRALVSYQPVLNTTTIPGQVTINAAGADFAKWKVNVTAGYSLGSFNLTVLHRWRDRVRPSSNPAAIYAFKWIESAAFTDLTLGYNFKLAGGQEGSMFLNVQNLFDHFEPGYLFGNTAVVTNLGPPGFPGDDQIGRFFTVGMRMKL